MRGIPVVIKGDASAVAAANLWWDPRRLARECGDMEPNWARTVGAFVDGLSVSQQKEWDTRQGLTSVHFSAQPEPFLTRNIP